MFVDLAVMLAAIGIDANPCLGDLQGAAFGAVAADEAEEKVAIAVQRGERGLLVLLGAHAALHLEQPVEGQIFDVVTLFAALGQRAGDAAAGRIVA